MRKERVVVSALGRWESAKKKTREETIVERARASLAELVETPLRFVHPKHFRLLPFASVPKKKREPQTAKKKKWHRNPPRGDASAPTFGDHHRIVLFVGRPLSPKSFPRFEIAVASTPHQSHLVHGARFFFFRSRHHERKRPNTTHLFARRIVGPKATGARTSETGGPSPFASLLFFAPQKNAPFFSSSWSSSSSSSAAATLWRVLHAF